MYIQGSIMTPMYTIMMFTRAFSECYLSLPRIWLAASIITPISVVRIVQSSYPNQSIQFQSIYRLDAKLIANGQ